MSHRFKVQPSPAPSIRFAQPQNQQSPVSAPGCSRFRRPSSTQQPLPTPRSDISRFRQTPKARDEIETSFETAERSSPKLPSRSRFSSSISQSQDLVDEVEDDDSNDPVRTAANPRPRNRRDPSPQIADNNDDNDDDDDDLADLEFLERLRGTRVPPISPTINTEVDSSSSSSSSSTSDSDEIPFTPIAASKRRRLNNRTDDDSNAPALAARANDQDYHHQPKEQANPLPSSSSSSSPPRLAPPPQPPGPGILSSRFKLFHHRTPKPTPRTHTTTTTTTTRKPIFRPLHPQASMSAAHLPAAAAAFSPSRHRHRRRRPCPRRRWRGGFDYYLPGGAADTVRNLILGLGGEVEGAGAGAGRRGADVERVGVGAVVGGGGGGAGAGARCVLARSSVGRGWVFVGGDGGTEKKKKTVEGGRVVGVRMGWDVDLSREGGAGGDGGGDGGEGVWKVAVLWDVLDGRC